MQGVRVEDERGRGPRKEELFTSSRILKAFEGERRMFGQWRQRWHRIHAVPPRGPSRPCRPSLPPLQVHHLRLLLPSWPCRVSRYTFFAPSGARENKKEKKCKNRGLTVVFVVVVAVKMAEKEEEATQPTSLHSGGSAGAMLNGTNHRIFGERLEAVMARPGERRIPTALKKLFLFLNGEGTPIQASLQTPHFQMERAAANRLKE